MPIAVIIAAAVLTFSIWTGTSQRIQAAGQLETAVSEQVDRDPTLARLLAIEAYRQHPDAASHAALVKSMLSSPGLNGNVTGGGYGASAIPLPALDGYVGGDYGEQCLTVRHFETPDPAGKLCGLEQPRLSRRRRLS